MRDRLQQRLQEIGFDATIASDAGATMLPEPASAKTVLARVRTQPRFPALSVDLRDLAAVDHDGADLEVRGVIGEGGMGRVLLARQHSLAREVAIKTAKPGASDAAKSAILAEGAVTGYLEHPAIVPVHMLGVDTSGDPAMVMKRIEGVTWDTLMADPTHPGWEGWEGDDGDRLVGHLQILATVSNAVHFAHSRGILHRDIKPDNVLIGTFGDVYLADWGVACHLGDEDRSLCGTPSFMAPEMALGERMDERTDVYLLGAVLHLILTGVPRHDGPDVAAVLQHAAASPSFDYPDDVPAELADLANRACHVDPSERPAGAKAFRAALTDYLRHRDSAALAAQAERRLGSIRRLAEKKGASGDEQAELDRLIIESRFALTQALEQWSGNASARAVRDELDAILAAKRARAAELEKLDWEHNRGVSARGRAIVLTLFTIAAALVSLGALTMLSVPKPLVIFLIPLGLLVLMVATLILAHRHFQWNAVNKQATLAMFAPIILMVLGRFVGLFVPIDFSDHLMRDAFVTAMALLAVTITLFRWALWPALIAVAVGLGCGAWPEHAAHTFSVGMTGLIALASWQAWRASQT